MLVAFVIVLIAGVGVYIAVSQLAQQYAVVPSNSNAGQVVCAATASEVRTAEQVRFIASIPEGTPYYWSAPGGSAIFVTSGPLTVQYAQVGTKTVSLFYPAGAVWQRTTCSIVVK